MTRSHDHRLRPATAADGPALREFVFGVLAEHGLAPDPLGTDADLADVDASYRSSGGAFHVLEAADDRIIGCVGIVPLDGTTCELRKMYLAADARGLGLGRLLLDTALATARAAGFRRVVLETASVLARAVALYKAYGFTAFRPDHLAARCDAAYELHLDDDLDG